ncbi:T9SS type A sorting domain-containing protein [Avrilella dinanensis]|uniref:T9SS type A sorting domain-containing protein n=1 Tax=Avrilella dinanensis TaxID=2008672 RepID=UPI00240A17EA|nr:T9SS type A sorting domain-containing protein [Avrilella dinanensis]
MQKITLFLLLLISSNLFAQEESFPYHLEYWKPMGMEIVTAFPVDEGYLLFGRVSDYSPEDYPGLITDTQTQQDKLGESFQMAFATDADFAVINSSILPINLNFNHVIKGDDQAVYAYSNHAITKINSDGSVSYTQPIEGFTIESLAYHDGLLYGLQAKTFNPLTTQWNQEGKLITFEADSGSLLEEFVIHDPASLETDYLGIAVDDSGIYVMGTTTYNEDQTDYPPNYDFYYTEGAFQPFQQTIVSPSFSTYVGFLTKYQLNNPEQMQWSTYLGGQGVIYPRGGEVPRNFLQLINGDLYICYIALNSTNITTGGVYMPNVTNGTGRFLMRFSPSGERLMGTYLGELGGEITSVMDSFAAGVGETGKIVLFSNPRNASSEYPLTSPNAPYTEASFSNQVISEFSPDGQRMYATLTSNNRDMWFYSLGVTHRFKNVIAEPDGFKVFCWEREPGLSENYLTTDQKILDYAVENVYSVASYNDKPSSSDRFTETAFSIYPNPTNGVLYVNALSTESITQAKIYDLSGKQLLHLTFDNHQAQQQIAVEHLANGMYIIELSSEKHTQKTKFIKR